MNPLLITAPKEEPLSLQEMKEHLRVTHDQDNGFIQSVYFAAREEVEHRLGRQMILSTWELQLEAFPVSSHYSSGLYDLPCFTLPRPPLVSVVSIKYLDQAGVEQTVPSGDYNVDTTAEPGRVYPAYGKSWPGARRQPNAVKVRYTAGYDDGSKVPALDKHFIKLVASLLYEFRETTITGTIATQIEDLNSIFWSRMLPEAA